MKSLCIELPFISNWRSYEYFNFDGFIAWVINFLTLCFYVVLRSVNLDNFRGRFGCVLTTGFLFTTVTCIAFGYKQVYDVTTAENQRLYHPCL